MLNEVILSPEYQQEMIARMAEKQESGIATEEVKDILRAFQSIQGF